MKKILLTGYYSLRNGTLSGRHLQKKQLDKLLSAPDITQFVGLRDLAIMLTFAHVGLRLKELCSLKVHGLAFEGKGEVIIQQAKNRYARRVPMTRRLKAVSKAYVQKRGIIDTDALFISVETFGYWFYKQTANVAMLEEILNHSPPKFTLTYTGINKEDYDDELDNFILEETSKGFQFHLQSIWGDNSDIFIRVLVGK